MGWEMTAGISKMESVQSKEAESDCKDFKNGNRAVERGGK